MTIQRRPTRRDSIGFPRSGGAAATFCLLALLSFGAAWAGTPVRTWNPWGKESPEPYGYDVATAPDLPFGSVDPEDPPATLPDRPPDPRPAVLEVVIQLDRTVYSWFGTITATAEVRREGVLLAGCDSVVLVSAANPRVQASLADDGIAPDLTAGDGRYAGRFEIGAGEGEARPAGSYTATATAYAAGEIGSGTSAAFSLFSVRRWSGISTTDLPDVSDQYTAFFVSANAPGAGYHHVIRDLGLVRSASVPDAQIRIPILPRANAISGLSVTGTGVSGVSARDNVIAFTCDLTGATVRRVTIEFDAPSDLAALFIDRYQTGDIALRDFRNGYVVWNRYLHTAILGSGFTSPHGPGCIVDLHVTDLESGAPHSVDCMERVAVHLDDQAFNDGSGTYPSNIKWSGDALAWRESGDLDSLAFRFFSGANYGLAGKVAVDRRVVFFSGSRFFRHRYAMRNIDLVSHDFDFVWGREQWLYGIGSNRQAGDRGCLPADPAAYGGEYGIPSAQLQGSWFAAFDATSFYAIGVIAPEASAGALPDRVLFLCDPPLGNFTGEYPILPAGSCADMANLFFEKRLGVLAPGESAIYTFYQWGGYGESRDQLTEILWLDAGGLPGPTSAASGALSLRAGTGLQSCPNPMSRSTELSFDLAAESRVRLAIHDVSGRLVSTLADRRFAPGHHALAWRGRDRKGVPLPAGLYFSVLETERGREVLKVVIRR